MLRILKSLAANVATLSLAFILAVLIWGVAVRANDPVNQLPLRLSLQVTGRPADSAVSVEPESVEIVVEGPASILDELTPEDFTATIDLTEVTSGENTVPIMVHHSLDAIDLVYQIPESATVIVERIVRREIPVEVEVRGEAGRGYVLQAPVVDPAVIPVTGIASRVEALTEARVTLFLDGPQQDVVLNRRPIFYDRQGNIASVNGLEVGTEEVVVTVPVDQLAGYAAKPIIVDWQGEPAPGYRLLNVRVEPDSVLLSGQPVLLENLTRVRTEPVDISGLRESLRLPVALDLPAGVTVDEVQAVIVEIEIEPILTSSVIGKVPEIRALQEGLTLTTEIEEVRVFLFGPLDKLDSLQDDDVRVTLDLFGLEVGSHTLEPDADVSVSGVEVRSLQPSQLTIVITDAITMTNQLTTTNRNTETMALPSLAVDSSDNAGFGILLVALLAPATVTPGVVMLFRREKSL